MARADKRKFHYIYKTICLVNGKYYVGMHSTDNLDDGYLGSGTVLSRSVKKYGKENHIREILEFVETRSKLREREETIVNVDLLGDTNCMNLKLGGHGGWDHIVVDTESHKLSASKGGKIGSRASWEKVKNDPELLATHVKRSRESMQKLRDDGMVRYDHFAGKQHTAETILKMKESKVGHGVGDSNSQYGTCWMTSMELQKNKKVKKEDVASHIEMGWEVGRRMY